MTTIAAFIDHDGSVAIAADRGVTFSGIMFPQRKLYQVGGAFVAATGGTLVYRFLREWTDHPLGDTAEAMEHLSDSFRKWWRDRGNGKPDDQYGVVNVDTAMIAVVRGQAPHVLHLDGSTSQPQCGYFAVGSGYELAMGALHVARRKKLEAGAAVTDALMAACTHDAGTSWPFDCVTMDSPSQNHPPVRYWTIDSSDDGWVSHDDGWEPG